MIETPRLRLRQLTADDAPARLRLYADPLVERFMGPPPASEAEERANIERHREAYYARRGYGLWGVERRETGEIAGRCGLLCSAIGGREEVEISYLLGPAHRGQGLATEAARAVLAHAAGALRMERVVAVVDPANAPSARGAERLGMRREGEVPYKSFGVVRLYAWEAASA